MKKSKATQNSLAHTQALLTLLQLHQYKELCYQFYLYVEALEGAIVGGEIVIVTRTWILLHPNEATLFVQSYSVVWPFWKSNEKSNRMAL